MVIMNNTHIPNSKNILGDPNLFEQVEERDVPVEEVIDADEVFCTGTAVGITPVVSITYEDKKYVPCFIIILYNYIYVIC